MIPATGFSASATEAASTISVVSASALLISSLKFVFCATILATVTFVK